MCSELWVRVWFNVISSHRSSRSNRWTNTGLWSCPSILGSCGCQRQAQIWIQQYTPCNSRMENLKSSSPLIILSSHFPSQVITVCLCIQHMTRKTKGTLQGSQPFCIFWLYIRFGSLSLTFNANKKGVPHCFISAAQLISGISSESSAASYNPRKAQPGTKKKMRIKWMWYGMLFICTRCLGSLVLKAGWQGPTGKG